jgi:hypothetical protein
MKNNYNNNQKKYNWLTLFKNKGGGKPMLKNKQPIIDQKNGGYVLVPEFTAILKIEEPLAIGEYEIKLREKISKNGSAYFGGGVHIKEQINYKPNSHQEAKQNGYQPQVDNPETNFVDDEIPF